MSAALFTLPFPVAFTSRGVGAPRAKVYFYQTGTLTALPVYTTSALTTQASNPSTADGAGRFDAIYLDNTKTYRVVINDKTGAQLCDVDPYIPGQAPDAGSLQPYADAAAASASSSSGSATASAASAAAGIISQAAALLSANNAAVSEGNAGNSATTAGNASTSAASILSSILLALAGTSLGTATLAASSRTAMASLSHSAGIPAYLSEGVRAGMFLPMSAAVYNATTGRTLTADVATDTGNNIIVPYSGDSTGASGAWVYPYWSQDVSARLFGATDGTDVKTAVEAWANVTWQLPCHSTSCRVVGTASLPLVVGASTNSQTKLIRFAPKINATAAMDVLVTLQNTPGSHVDHSGMSLFGNASTSSGQAWSSRLAGYGIRWLNTLEMTSSGRIQCYNFKYWGGLLHDAISGNGQNSNYTQLPELRCVSCGLGKRAGGTSSMSANWSTPTRLGSSSSASQTTTINVSQVPDTDAVEATAGWVAWINGYPYSMSTVVASGDPTYPYTVTLRNPWLDDTSMTAGTGTLDYTIGGGLLALGGDSNVVKVLGVFATNCGYSFIDATAYGVTPQRLSSDSGVDIIYGFGSGANSAHAGGGFDEMYVEGATALAQVISLGVSNSSAVKIGKFTGAGVDFTKWFKHGTRATGSNNLASQAMSEIDRVDGYQGQLVVAQNGPTFTATYDPPSVANGASVSTTISIPASNIPLGTTHRVRFNQNLSGMTMQAYVSATFTASVTMTCVFSNLTGGAVDLPSGTITVTTLQ